MSLHQDWDRWTVACRVVTTDPAALTAARDVCDRVMDEVEAAISTWRPDSELLNLRPGWNEVSPVLAGALTAALWAARATDGALDPTLGDAVSQWRHSRDAVGHAHSVANERRLRLLHAGPDWRTVAITGRRVWLAEGVHLDLGAVDKAFAVDLAARRAAAGTRAGVLVSLGGDIATAGFGPLSGWQVLVQDRPDDVRLTISLANGMSIATSSTEHRRIRAEDRTSAHLLDPETGMPVRSPWRTATVVAPTCVKANTYAAGAIVLGARAQSWLSSLGAPARLIDIHDRVHELGGFPRERAA